MCFSKPLSSTLAAKPDEAYYNSTRDMHMCFCEMRQFSVNLCFSVRYSITNYACTLTLTLILIMSSPTDMTISQKIGFIHYHAMVHFSWLSIEYLSAVVIVLIQSCLTHWSGHWHNLAALQSCPHTNIDSLNRHFLRQGQFARLWVMKCTYKHSLCN